MLLISGFQHKSWVEVCQVRFVSYKGLYSWWLGSLASIYSPLDDEQYVDKLLAEEAELSVAWHSTIPVNISSAKVDVQLIAKPSPISETASSRFLWLKKYWLSWLASIFCYKLSLRAWNPASLLLSSLNSRLPTYIILSS